MTEMIEHAAKAIVEDQAKWAAGGIGGPYMARRAARAAIEAMREPTKEMELSGAEEINAGCAFTTNEATRVWKAMIDAALGKVPE